VLAVRIGDPARCKEIVPRSALVEGRPHRAVIES